MATITLNVGVDSYLSVLKADTSWRDKYFNLPGISQWDGLNEAFNSEQSQLLLRASKDIDYFLRSYVLPFFPPNHSIIYQPEGLVHTYMEESTFVHALHLLLYSSYLSPSRFGKSKKIGPLSSAVDTEGLHREVGSLSPLSYKLLDMYLRELRDKLKFGMGVVSFTVLESPDLPFLSDNKKSGLSPLVHNLNISRA